MISLIRKSLTNLTVFSIFLVTSLVVFKMTHRYFYLFDLPYIGFSIFLGLSLYQYLPKQKRQIGRRVSQFMVGFYFLFFLSLIIKVNMQVEGFFFQILSLFFGGAFIHYSIAKLFGPLYFGRGFCGWACWNAMIFDLLPWKRSPGRIRYLGLIRYMHLFLSVAAVFILFYIFKYNVVTGDYRSLTWFVAGNIVYYLTGIVSSFIIKDNRAFCKYFCPIPPIQKILNRFSVVKVKIDKNKCTECGLCEKACPMDIKILEYKKNDERIKSTECILCNACNNSCSMEAISLSSGMDMSTKEHITYR